MVRSMSHGSPHSPSRSSPPSPPRVWCNMTLPDALADHLRREVAVDGGELVFANKTYASNLVAGEVDPLIRSADVAYGQPRPRDVIDCPRVMWVHINTAGYT